MSYHQIAIVMVCAVTFLIFLWTFVTNKIVKEAPGFLITLGIAFTFFGIASGLSDFDINDPGQSLGSLIDGIKTVFWGSFAGVVAAIVMRLINAVFFYLQSRKTTKEDQQTKKYLQEHSALVGFNKSNNDLLGQLNQNLEKNNQTLLEGLKQLGANFTTDAHSNAQNALSEILPILKRLEASQNQSHTDVMVQKLENFQHSFDAFSQKQLAQLTRLEESQDKSHTTVLVEEIKQLKDSFDDFAKQQAEQNAEIFIRALEQAIQDFNKQLATQLGENFRELNQAVFKLTNWQENYAQHVEQQTEAYGAMAQNLENMQQRFALIADDAARFTSIAEDLEGSLSILTQRQQAIEKHLTRFYEEIDKKAYDIEQMRKNIEDALETTQQIHAENKQQILELAKDTAQYFVEIGNNQDKLVSSVMQKSGQLQEAIKQDFSKSQQYLSEQMSIFKQHQSEQMGILQRQQAEIFNQSLQGLAQQLASLSAKFASDYGPITENLARIVRMNVRQQ